MIVSNNLTFEYSKNGSGIKDVSFSVDNNETVAIVGKNGSGKSTIIRNIMGFLKPVSGEVFLDNKNPFESQETLMNEVGYISGELSLMESLKSKDLFNIRKKIFNLKDDSYLNHLIDIFQLNINKKIKTLSKGNKQKVAIILSLMNEPKYLILDEPTSGLDFEMQNIFWNEILKYKNKNCSILLCSHIASEIENVADKIIYLDDGKIVDSNVFSNHKIVLEEK